MTRRVPPGPAPRRAVRFVLGTVLAAGLLLPLAPQSASACDVSYDYKPSIDLQKRDFGHGHTCSASTSLGGVTIVALLALGALAAAAATAYKRGARTAGAPSAGPGPSPVLAAYLQATGLDLRPKPARPPGPPQQTHSTAPGYPQQGYQQPPAGPYAPPAQYYPGQGQPAAPYPQAQSPLRPPAPRPAPPPEHRTGDDDANPTP